MCTSSFVTSLGRLLYRRPLVDREVTNLARLFDVAVKAGDDFEVGSRLVLQAMLQSPNFLYGLERTDRIESDTDLATVDGYEMASRLSFLLWQSGPDAQLLDVVEQGGMEAAVDAIPDMLQSAKARRGARVFVEEWLSLYKLVNIARDPELYPQFSPELMVAMYNETLDFFETLVFDDPDSFMAAFTRERSTFEPELEKIYDVPSGPGAHDWSEDPTRGDFLTQAGLITAHTVVDDWLDVNGGTLLDNATVLMGTELGDPVHNLNGLTFMIGGGDGRFKKGLHTFNNRTDVDLYNTILTAHGIPKRVGTLDNYTSDITSILA